MNRKLRHRSLALSAIGAMLVLGTLTTAASRQLSGHDQDRLAEAAVLTAEAAAVSALAAALQQPTPAAEAAEPSTSRPARNATRHRRQSLLMPYFSFAPRG